MSLIELSNVTKDYGSVRALDDVTFRFDPDVTTAVVGPSGSGKSTLLQTINGLAVPTSGRVSVFGQPIDYARLPELRRRIGYAVQGTGLFPHLTVERNITLLARLVRLGDEQIPQRLSSLMTMVGLTPDLVGRYPHELSGGQQQRVGLCRAMMLDPPIFLLDEPFGALDPITRNDIHKEFLHIQQSSARTMILVTHDLREAVKIAQYVVIMNHGRIAQHGRCDDVCRNPADSFVEKFLRAQLED